MIRFAGALEKANRKTHMQKNVTATSIQQQARTEYAEFLGTQSLSMGRIVSPTCQLNKEKQVLNDAVPKQEVEYLHDTLIR